jgi:hypothetical protein
VGEGKGGEGRERVKREREGEGGAQDFAGDVDNFGMWENFSLDKM